MNSEKRNALRHNDQISIYSLVAADHDALWDIAADPLLWHQHPAKERNTKNGFRAFFEDSMSKRISVVCKLNESGETIGISSYYELDEAEGHVSIGFTFISRALWGTGINAQFKQLMIAHAKETWNVNRILLHVAEGNQRSEKAIKKLGATRTPTLRESTYNGSTVTSFEYELMV